VIPFEQLKMEWLLTEKGETPDDFVVPLSRQAIALSRNLHETTGTSRYLFPGCSDAEVMSENTLNNALHSLGYKGVHCAHGFRASASTILNRQRTEQGRRRFETALVEIQQDRLPAGSPQCIDSRHLRPRRSDARADRVDASLGGQGRRAA
jgi:hypothetical protein